MSWLSDIWNAITSIWNFITAIPRAINSVISWATSTFSDIYNYADRIYNDTVGWIKSDIAYAFSLYQAAVAFAQSVWNNLYSWAVNELAALSSFISQVYSDAINFVHVMFTAAVDLLNGFINWVNVNILVPFTRDIADLFKWVTTDGYYIWNLITHPDQLAALIGKYILGAWISLGKQFALPFFRWLIASMISLAPTFESVFEEIISSLFD